MAPSNSLYHIQVHMGILMLRLNQNCMGPWYWYLPWGSRYPNIGRIHISGPRAPGVHILYPRPPNVPLSRALWSLLDGSWGVLKGSWGVLDITYFGVSSLVTLLSWGCLEPRGSRCDLGAPRLASAGPRSKRSEPPKTWSHTS